MWLKLLKTIELVLWVCGLVFALGLIYNSILIVLLDLGFKNFHPLFNPAFLPLQKFLINVPKYNDLSLGFVLNATIGLFVGLKLIDVTITNMQSCYFSLLSKAVKTSRIKRVDDPIFESELYPEPYEILAEHRKKAQIAEKLAKKQEEETKKFEEAIKKAEKIAAEKEAKEEKSTDELIVSKKSETEEKDKEKLHALEEKMEAEMESLEMPSAFSIKAHHFADVLKNTFQGLRKAGEYAVEQKEALIDKEALDALATNPTKKIEAPVDASLENDFLRAPSFKGLLKYALHIRTKPKKPD